MPSADLLGHILFHVNIYCGPALQHSFVAVMQPERAGSFWFILILGLIALWQSLPQPLIVHESVLLELTPLLFFLCLEQNIRCL